MRFVNIKIFWAACLFVPVLILSAPTQATVISYNGYSRDSSSNIVTGGGLEWLMWSVTDGMSISSALSTYQSAGWSLASHPQMSALLSAFWLPIGWPSVIWTAAEADTTSLYLDYTETEVDGVFQFTQLFGETFRNTGAYPDENQYGTGALFGEDVNGNSNYNAVYLGDDSILNHFCCGPDPQELNGWVEVYGDWYNVNTGYPGSYGVALVRATAVPEPTTLALFSLGLAGLGLTRSRRRKPG